MNALTAQPRQQYIFTHLGIRDGLAGEEVMGVCQDKKGFIWIATVNGLQRFDGQRFLTFRHRSNDPTTIPDNIILAMQQDRKGRLWMLFSENRIGYLDQSDLQFHPIPVRVNKEILQNLEGVLFVDNRDNIILRLNRVAFVTFNEATREFSSNYNPFTIPNGWRPYWLLHDRDNNYWLSCDSGLVKYNPAKKTLSYRNHNVEQDKIINAYAHLQHVSQSYFDRSGRFWLVSWHPYGPGPFFYSYDIKTNTTREWETNLFSTLQHVYHEVRSISEQDDSTIWITGLNLFARLPKNGNNFEAIPNNLPGEFSIRYDITKNLFEDREMNIWVSTDKGLFRFNPSAQLFDVVTNRRIGPKDTTYTSDVSDIYQAKNGEILVNTWGNGLFIYDNNFNPVKASFVDESARLGEMLNWCIFQRSNGDIWRGSQDGYIFITYAATKKSEAIHPAVLAKNTVRQIVEDKLGNLWLGTQKGWLVKWNAATNTFTPLHNLTTIYRLYTDKRGDIWACTGGRGVFRINPADGSIAANYTSAGPAGKKLFGAGAADILQYDDSLYAIGSGCLNILNIKTGAIRYYSAENGLPSNSINNIILDRQRNIWITTDSRLCRLSIEKSTLTVFTEEDGISTSTFNVASSALLHDGRIAIGRTHDMIVFDPEKTCMESLLPPPVEITGFSLMNTNLSMDSLKQLPEIRLRYNQNSMVLQFSTLTYMTAYPVSYMMEGLDKQWQRANASREAIYTYLPPGDYTFKIRTQNADGKMSAVQSLSISVRAPFWKTWWFYSALALGVATLFYWDDRVKHRRKIMLEKMRSEVAGNLHEEINKALSNINVLSEIARIKAEKDPEQSISYITEIRQKSHNMIIAMDDMLWSIDPANDSMGKTISRIREFAAALRNRHEVIINLQTDEKVILLKPDMKIRHEIMIIYKLGLRLLVEEMKAPQTTIHIDYLKSHLQLNIFSHNVMLPDNNQSIRMIEEMKMRAASIMASLEFQSDEKGTAIILVVKT